MCPGCYWNRAHAPIGLHQDRFFMQVDRGAYMAWHQQQSLTSFGRRTFVDHKGEVLFAGAHGLILRLPLDRCTGISGLCGQSLGTSIASEVPFARVADYAGQDQSCGQ